MSNGHTTTETPVRNGVIRPSQSGCAEPDVADCEAIPNFDRLSYFHGQMLSAADLRTEQTYFRERMKLHNRCLHGHGVVCGLRVEICYTERDRERGRLQRQRQELRHALDELGSQPPSPAGEERRRALMERLGEVERHLVELDGRCSDDVGPHVKIHPGVALDSCGNELVVRRPVVISLWSLLGDADRARLVEPSTVYVSACWCQHPLCRVRPVLPDACGTAAEEAFSKLRDSVRFEVRLDPPPADERCEPCCAPNGVCECCVLLARVAGVARGAFLDAASVDNGVRRPLATYVPTRVEGISWTHGATYTPEEAREILGTRDPEGGIEVRFTREVDVRTLRAGVLDFWVIDGGSGRNGNIWQVDGEYVDLPTTGSVRSIRYRQTSTDSLNDGDRLMILLRGAFVLDRCCQPVSGVHVGGRVPLLDDYSRFGRENGTEPFCVEPPWFPGPWTSGSPQGGTTFESWFFIGENRTERT